MKSKIDIEFDQEEFSLQDTGEKESTKYFIIAVSLIT